MFKQKHMLRRIAATFLVCASALTGFCETPHSNVMTVVKNDNSETNFFIVEKPVISLTADAVKVNFNEGHEIQFPLSEFKHVYYQTADTPSGITDVSGKQANLFTLTRTAVQAVGLEAGSAVTVYTLDGRQVAAAQADASGSVTVSIESLSAGVYVLQSSASTFKFVK